MNFKRIILFSCLMLTVLFVFFSKQKQTTQSTLETYSLLKPNGTPAHYMDPMILLNVWTHYLEKENRNNNVRKIIFAGIGKPSYLLNEDLVIAASKYWNDYLNKIVNFKVDLNQKSYSENEVCDLIANAELVIDYGLPIGNPKARQIMSDALNNWYGSNAQISPDNIIFTVGGSGGLRAVFRVINERSNYGRIITPKPYYPLYANPGHKNNLYFIDVMKEPGYKLTATALEKTIKDVNDLALKDGKKIGAFLFCDPNNPLGSVIGKSELKKIAEVLKKTPSHIPIILDEAYAEMVFDSKHVSLLQVAPELKDRLIIMRSATKAFSASGERMAILICFNKQLLSELENELVLTNYHAPESIQFAYAYAMAGFNDEKRKALSRYYQIQVDFAQKRLKELNIDIEKNKYKVDATFYVIADLSILFGSKIPKEAQRALGTKTVIETDQDICYSLLFEDQVMVMPLSYFGVDPKLGFVRITCSGGITQLDELMNRIQARIKNKLK